MKTVFFVISALFAALALGSATAADPAAAIKYRQAVMTAQGGHMAAIASIIKGEVDHKPHLPAHIEAIAGTAKMVRDLFPAGSDKGDTQALPGIWQRPAAFREAYEALEAAAPKLVEKSGGADALRTAFGEVARACKGCHDNFRKPK
jgi:cytochrome c556